MFTLGIILSIVAGIGVILTIIGWIKGEDGLQVGVAVTAICGMFAFFTFYNC